MIFFYLDQWLPSDQEVSIDHPYQMILHQLCLHSRLLTDLITIYNNYDKCKYIIYNELSNTCNC